MRRKSPQIVKKINKSTRLRKYAVVYNSCNRKLHEEKSKKSPRKSRNLKNQKEDPKIKKKSPKKTQKKSLNSYQKFVKHESKKEKYKTISASKRLSLIAVQWKKINRKI